MVRCTTTTSKFPNVQAAPLVSTTGGTIAALFDGDTTFINNARIRNLTADQIDTTTITSDVGFLNTLTVTDLNIVNGSVTSPYTLAHPSMPKTDSGSSISMTLDDFPTIPFATGQISGTVQIQFQCTALMNFFIYRVEARQGSGSWGSVGAVVTGNHAAVGGIIQSAPIGWNPPTPNVPVQIRVVINAQVNAGGTHGFTCNWATVFALVHKK